MQANSVVRMSGCRLVHVVCYYATNVSRSHSVSYEYLTGEICEPRGGGVAADDLLRRRDRPPR